MTRFEVSVMNCLGITKKWATAPGTICTATLEYYPPLGILMNIICLMNVIHGYLHQACYLSSYLFLGLTFQPLVDYQIVLDFSHLLLSGSCLTDYVQLDLDEGRSPGKKVVKLCGNITDIHHSFLSYHQTIKITIRSQHGWLSYRANYTISQYHYYHYHHY